MQTPNRVLERHSLDLSDGYILEFYPIDNTAITVDSLVITRLKEGVDSSEFSTWVLSKKSWVVKEITRVMGRQPPELKSFYHKVDPKTFRRLEALTEICNIHRDYALPRERHELKRLEEEIYQRKGIIRVDIALYVYTFILGDDDIQTYYLDFVPFPDDLFAYWVGGMDIIEYGWTDSYNELIDIAYKMYQKYR